MATNEQVERALNFIRNKAKEFAKAKADRVYLEQFRKSKKATLMQVSDGKTIADREAFAYSHTEYLALLEALKIAVEIEEKLKYEIKVAELKFEQWRTQQANRRAERARYDSA